MKKGADMIRASQLNPEQEVESLICGASEEFLLRR
jgi:hypothetical protein